MRSARRCSLLTTQHENAVSEFLQDLRLHLRACRKFDALDVPQVGTDEHEKYSGRREYLILEGAELRDRFDSFMGQE